MTDAEAQAECLDLAVDAAVRAIRRASIACFLESPRERQLTLLARSTPDPGTVETAVKLIRQPGMGVAHRPDPGMWRDGRQQPAF